MAKPNPDSYSGENAAMSPGTPAELETFSVLTTTVDGGSGLTTATAARRASGVVRSRSRSPHPAAFGERRTHEDAISPRTRPFQLKTDTRDSSFELQSFLPSPDNISLTDLSSLDGRDHGREAHDQKRSRGLLEKIADTWEESKGLFMVIMAMFFSACMGATARLMQVGPSPMHVLQILFARQSITAVITMLFIWWKKIPDAPFGRREVRWLLIARGVGGFWGVFSLYFAVKYLPLAEATVITFLAPSVANAVCSLLMKDPFTRREQIAGAISFLGVVLIAQPFGLSSPDTGVSQDIMAINNSTINAGTSSTTHAPEATPAQRLIAIGVSLIGVCGAACAYTTIRWIGKRAHPLITTQYFSVWCTFVSLMCLLFVPGIDFRFPANLREWTLLTSLGVSGFALQYLLTAGLGRQKGSAATNMTYTQMVFTLLIDYTLFGTVLTWASGIGAATIVGSQIWGSMARGEALKQKELTSTSRVAETDEEVGLVEGQDHNGIDDESSLTHRQ